MSGVWVRNEKQNEVQVQAVELGHAVWEMKAKKKKQEPVTYNNAQQSSFIYECIFIFNFIRYKLAYTVNATI